MTSVASLPEGEFLEEEGDFGLQAVGSGVERGGVGGFDAVAHFLAAVVDEFDEAGEKAALLEIEEIDGGGGDLQGFLVEVAGAGDVLFKIGWGEFFQQRRCPGREDRAEEKTAEHVDEKHPGRGRRRSCHTGS